MATLVVRNARAVVSLDALDTVYADGYVVADGPEIVSVGSGEPPARGDRTIDAAGMIVFPGMVNTHHHLYQSLTRAIPAVQEAPLFGWLKHLYTVWRHLTPEGVRISTQVACGELLLSGCTTTSDHLYLFPAGTERLIDAEIAAASEIGIRFHPTRGSMSRGTSLGGLPPDDVVQTRERILEDSIRVIEAHHDRNRFSMCRVGLAPCSPFSIDRDLMAETAELARKHGVRLHTHLAETLDEEDYCHEMYGCRPVELMEKVGWLGNDVWFAHCVHLNEDEIGKLAETGTGVAHCPTSNMRLGSGIAPLVRMLEAGVPVGLGVDGSASNDSNNMLAEARASMLVHRLVTGERWLGARECLRVATQGGARVLGRDDIGSIEKGKAADLVMLDTRTLAFAGSGHDPVAALLFCSPNRPADFVVVNGRVVVEGGRLVSVDERELAARAEKEAERMARRRA